jgi:Holliday junction resolvase RusA-like endonuclease
VAAGAGEGDAPVSDYRPCASCRGRGFANAGEFAYGCMRCEHTFVTAVVRGVPAPKGSGRAIMRGRFAVMVASTSNKNRTDQRSWDAAVRDAMTEQLGCDRKEPLFRDRALHLTVTFMMPRPSGHWSAKGGVKPSAPAHPAKKPDLDKLLRCTCDALTGLVYDDDSRVVQTSALKSWAQPGHEGAIITVRPVDG